MNTRGLLLCGVLLAVAARADESPESGAPAVFRDALSRVARGLVRIDTVGGAQPVEGDDTGRAAAGFRVADGPTTGLVWSADGLILASSFNFWRDPTLITVTLSDGRRLVAEQVAQDSATRSVLLRVPARDLQPAQWVERAALRPGQWALAAGFGGAAREPALSVGVVSALHRVNGLAVQCDTKTSPVNYGGALFDVEGRVIGLISPMSPGEEATAGVQWYDSGVGFAIPRDVLAPRVEEMSAGRDLRPGLLGVMLDAAEPVVGETAIQPGAPEGIAVAQEPTGPAAVAGLRAGDVIIAIDGAAVRRLADLRRALARKWAGATVQVQVWRAAATLELSLVLVTAEDAAASQPASDATEP